MLEPSDVIRTRYATLPLTPSILGAYGASTLCRLGSSLPVASPVIFCLAPELFRGKCGHPIVTNGILCMGGGDTLFPNDFGDDCQKVH